MEAMPLVTMSPDQSPRSWGLPSKKPEHGEGGLEAVPTQWGCPLEQAEGVRRRHWAGLPGPSLGHTSHSGLHTDSPSAPLVPV